MEDLIRADKVNENYMDLMVRMKNNFFFQSYREKQRYESGSSLELGKTTYSFSINGVPGEYSLILYQVEHPSLLSYW
mgnify:CR=1 FL=1